MGAAAGSEETGGVTLFQCVGVTGMGLGMVPILVPMGIPVLLAV